MSIQRRRLIHAPNVLQYFTTIQISIITLKITVKGLLIPAKPRKTKQLRKHRNKKKNSVTCQAHPVLVKLRRIRYAIRAFLNFLSRWLPNLLIFG